MTAAAGNINTSRMRSTSVSRTRSYACALAELCTNLRGAIVTTLYARLPVAAAAAGKIQPNGILHQTLHDAVTSLSDRHDPREELFRQHSKLCCECSLVQNEYKHLRHTVDQLARDYSASKEFDCFRRYATLKRMIKRSVVHLKLSSAADESWPQQLEQRQRALQRITDMTSQEILTENDELREQIKESRRRVLLIKDLLERMEESYEHSKRYVAFHRYRLLKVTVKTVIRNKWI